MVSFTVSALRDQGKGLPPSPEETQKSALHFGEIRFFLGQEAFDSMLELRAKAELLKRLALQLQARRQTGVAGLIENGFESALGSDTDMG